MATTESATDLLGGPYPEEILLEAYSLEWQSIEIRRQRLHKTWQQILLVERMEEEERQYQRQLRRLKRKEQVQQEEKTREVAERAAAKHAEALVRERRKVRKESEARAEMEMERRRKARVVRNDSQSDEERPRELLKVRKTKTPKPIKKAKKPEKPKPAPLPKRITPIAVSAVRSQPQTQPETDESVTEEYPPELGGYDSPPPELPADDLLNMLSLDKGSDTDLDDEPSMTSLILPVALNSPKKANGSPARTKKTSTPQKRFPRNKGGPSLDFNFTNAEAKRQAKAAALAEQAEEEDGEPEPMLSPSTLAPKKHLKRRKEVMLERQAALNAAGGTSLMESVATAAKKRLKPKANSTIVRSTEEDAVLPVKKKPANKVKAVIPPARAANAKRVEMTKDKRGGKVEKMTIKQRLANAEMLARMNKMQEMNTPKVPFKKTKKTQMRATMKSLAAKRAEFRKILAEAPTDDQGGLRRRQAVDETELNTSMNSNHSGKSGSDGNDSPRKQLALKRKRAKETPEEEDVTPTKKLQFLEITKRLAKSPMPRFLRTPTPRMSPMIPSALGRPPPRRTSPDAQGIGDLNTPKTMMAVTPLTKAAAKDYATRRMSSGPTRAKKTVNANTFGIPAGGTGGGSAAAGGGGFSMFDAFVNSGAGGGIPRLKTSTKGSRDGSPTV